MQTRWRRWAPRVAAEASPPRRATNTKTLHPPPCSATRKWWGWRAWSAASMPAAARCAEPPSASGWASASPAPPTACCAPRMRQYASVARPASTSQPPAAARGYAAGGASRCCSRRRRMRRARPRCAPGTARASPPPAAVPSRVRRGVRKKRHLPGALPRWVRQGWWQLCEGAWGCEGARCVDPQPAGWLHCRAWPLPHSFNRHLSLTAAAVHPASVQQLRWQRNSVHGLPAFWLRAGRRSVPRLQRRQLQRLQRRQHHSVQDVLLWVLPHSVQQVFKGARDGGRWLCSWSPAPRLADKCAEPACVAAAVPNGVRGGPVPAGRHVQTVQAHVRPGQRLLQAGKRMPWRCWRCRQQGRPMPRLLHAARTDVSRGASACSAWTDACAATGTSLRAPSASATAG